MAIDVIYTMAAILKDSISPFKRDIIDVLSHARVDKIKPVREAATEAIAAVKEIHGLEPLNDEFIRSESIISRPHSRGPRDPSPIDSL